jgi:O-6-methylguanine DNA methyltransferase
VISHRLPATPPLTQSRLPTSLHKPRSSLHPISKTSNHPPKSSSIPTQSPNPSKMTTLAPVKVTAYQERVYALLLQIPSGRISSYACLSRALKSSPRAVGGALRNNPFAPEVPCHRVISASGVCSSSLPPLFNLACRLGMEGDHDCLMVVKMGLICDI